MKQLTLIRHGAAASAQGKQKDFARVLNERGRAEAVSIAQQLKQQRFNFDQMYCSPAQRALTTAQIIHDTLKPNTRPLLADQALYNFELEPLYRFIEMIDDDIQHAVIVAHNPGLSYLVNTLLREPVYCMSTCTAVQIQLNIDQWVDIKNHCGQLLTIDNPV